MVGNEAAIPSGEVVSRYFPKISKDTTDFIPVENVKWITTLRHPYSRTLSHYQHVLRLRDYKNLSLQEFLTESGGGFHRFIPNQQTRWHCGTGECVKGTNIVTREFLQRAIENLEKMHAVLILEDMKDPNSCSRRQMRHVFNFSKLEAFNDTTRPQAHYTSKTDWDEAVRPYLNVWGLNETIRGFGTNATATAIHNTSSSMGPLALHNAFDLELYGYARRLCESLADKYDMEDAIREIQHQQREKNAILWGQVSGIVVPPAITSSSTAFTLLGAVQILVMTSIFLVCILVPRRKLQRGPRRL